MIVQVVVNTGASLTILDIKEHALFMLIWLSVLQHLYVFHDRIYGLFERFFYCTETLLNIFSGV